jgi:hypothetical protein
MPVRLGPPPPDPPFADPRKRSEPAKPKPLPRRMPKTMKFEKPPKFPKWA